MFLKIKHLKFIITVLILVILTSNILIVGEEQSQYAFNYEQQKTIYLTFDDGPSTKVTSEILDILKDKDVKATFFVVGYKIKEREDILKRIHSEGHAIGLHSYTHNFRKVYASEKAFLDEMDRTSKLVKELTGIEPNIIRFPGGSINRLNSRFLRKIHNMNYKVYDWNACVSDAIDYKTPPEKLFIEATHILGNPSRIILLMHCDVKNKNTCKVLPKVIDYYKTSNYKFKVITYDTQELYFNFQK